MLQRSEQVARLVAHIWIGSQTVRVKIALAHVYADDNKGDLGIIQAILSGLRRRASLNGKEVEFTAISMFSQSEIDRPEPHRFLRLMVERIAPAPVTQRYEEPRSIGRSLVKVATIPCAVAAMILRGLAWRMIKVPGVLGKIAPIFHSDMLICKGGSLLYCKGSIRELFFLTRMLMPLYTASLVGKPTFIFGQSIGPFATKTSQWIFREFSGRNTHFYVRDEKSRGYLVNIGIPSERITLVPDPAFMIGQGASYEKLPQPCSILAITALNVSREPTLQATYEAKMARVIQGFLTDHPGWKARFIPQVIGPDRWQDDRLVQARIASQLSAELGSRIDLDERDLSPDELCAQYAQADLLIASRLHSSIFASVAETPAVVLEYQQAKAEGAFTWLGRYDDVLPWTAPEQDIRSRLDLKVKLLTSERAYLKIRIAELSGLLNEAIDDLFDRAAEYPKT